MSPAASTSEVMEVGGRQLKVSNLAKVLYPEAGFTKAAVIDYYARVAEHLLPHLADRPLTLKRYPNGVDKGFFYEKTCPKHRPDWVRTATIRTTGGGGRWGAERTTKREDAGSIDYCVIDELAALVWIANLASLELHTPMHLAGDSTVPRMMVFDLDPGDGSDIIDCAAVGAWVRELFDGLDMQTFPKTSGSKGLQVYVPLNGDDTYEKVTPFTKAVAELLERQHPDKVVSKQDKSLRVNKVLIDWSQNVEAKTTSCVYSLRARPRPTVSTPVTWDEVTSASSVDDLTFEAGDVLDRVASVGDLQAPVLTLVQPLPTLGG